MGSLASTRVASEGSSKVIYPNIPTSYLRLPIPPPQQISGRPPRIRTETIAGLNRMPLPVGLVVHINRGYKATTIR